MSKKVLSLVLALVMVLGTFGTAFADTAETTAAPALNEKIEKLKEMGLIQGYEDGTFGLENPITRAEMATMLVRSLGLESAATASAAFPSQFSDMNGANVLWARGYVNVAVGQGVVKGYPEGTFLPANNVTYAEAIAMLVRAGNHITAAEEAVAVWPATYLTKAAQIGLLNGVEGIVDYNAPALRGKLFELVYNAAEIGGNLFVASTLQGIVVENYRTESLDKDEIVVHAMKDQVARSATDKEANTKYYEENDEFEVVLTEELAKKGLDVESLLGKVVEISFDRSNKIVDIKELAGYQYIIGEVDSITDKKIEINEKTYTVSKSEARDTADERLYQAYLNNKDVDYDALYTRSTANAEFANITVRNGKVLFIDAFKFEDIAPVEKDVTDNNRVYYYDDSRDGAVANSTDIGKDYVLNFEDGKLSLGNKADIKANDVIHFFGKTVIVRPLEDNSVEGKFERVTDNRKDEEINIKVDGTDYEALVPNDNNKRNPVYSTGNKNGDFKEIEYRNYSSVLEPFKNEEVTLLRDINGRVQLITSDRVDASFLAVVVRTMHPGFRLYTENNETRNLDANVRETTVKFDGKTRYNDKDAWDIVRNDLVRATAKDELLTVIDKLSLTTEVYTGVGGAEQLTAVIKMMDKNNIEFVDGRAGGRDIARNAVIFTTDRYKAYTVSEFLKAYGNRDNEILEEKGYTAAYYVNKNGLVEAIVVGNTGAAKDDTKILKVKDGFYKDGDYFLTLEDTKGEKADYLIDTDTARADYDSLMKKKDVIIEVDVTKDNEIFNFVNKDVAEFGPFIIVERNNDDFIVLEDAYRTVRRELRVTGDNVFGSYRKGDKVFVDNTADGGRIVVINQAKDDARLGYFDGSTPDEPAADTYKLTDAWRDEENRDLIYVEFNRDVYEYQGDLTLRELQALIGHYVTRTIRNDRVTRINGN